MRHKLNERKSKQAFVKNLICKYFAPDTSNDFFEFFKVS